MNTENPQHSPAKSWLAIIAISLIAYVGMVSVHWRFETLRDQYTTQTIGWYLLAFAVFVVAVVWMERRGGISMRWVWGPAILFRVLLLLTVPTLSDDVYRYLWDGYVATEGISPYAFAIDSAELDPYQNETRDLANNTWMASPYMPAAQLIFYALATVFPLNPIFMQGLMIVFDLLAAGVLAKLLALAQLPARRLLLYLWNPLVIVEVAHGAHIDAWMGLLTLLTIWLTFKPTQNTLSHVGAPVVFVLATLTKIIPVLALPVLFWRWSWRQLVGYAVLTVGLLIPFGVGAGWGLTGELNGRGLFGALRIYGNQWKFNSGIFHWLNFWLGKQPNVADTVQLSKMIVFAVMLTIMIVVWIFAYRSRSRRTDLRLLFVPFCAYILLTPTVHPWYTLLMLSFVPFLAPNNIGESRWRWLLVAPWLTLSALLIFSYITYLDPAAHGEKEWVRQLEWIPTLTLAVMALLSMPIILRRDGTG